MGRSTAVLAGAAVAVVTIAVVRATPSCTDCLMARYYLIAADDWKATGEPSFPETGRLSAKQDFGLAFSGGGTRSATATLGQLRGLEQNGWLDSVRYMSAVSGGAWAAIPFTYGKQTTGDLLGSFELPQTLKRDAVVHTPNGALAQAVANSSLTAGSVREVVGILAKFYSDKHADDLLAHAVAVTKRLRREPDRFNKTYARLLGRVFIDPLIEPGADSPSSRLFSWDAASVAEIAGANPGRLGGFVLANRRRPFLIVGGTLVSARRDYSYPLLMPVEYTPLYVGLRQRFGGRFGGSYVWPWAYDATQVGTTTGDLVAVHYDSSRRFTLADVAASTGAAPQLFLILGESVPDRFKPTVQSFAQYFPAFRHFAVQPMNGNIALTEEMPHADGGLEDNLGIMPLLARQVRNILVFVNTNTRYIEDNDDVQSLFFAVGPPGGSGDKTENKVFSDNLYGVLLRDLADARDRKEPQVYCGQNWSVLPNSHYNIRGYDGLNICWFYNAAVPKWENQLPDEVKRIVKGGDKSKEGRNFDDFPWFSTFEQNAPHVIQLSVAQVNLLANLTAWTVTNAETVRMIRSRVSVPLACPPSIQCTTETEN